MTPRPKTARRVARIETQGSFYRIVKGDLHSEWTPLDQVVQLVLSTGGMYMAFSSMLSGHFAKTNMYPWIIYFMSEVKTQVYTIVEGE